MQRASIFSDLLEGETFGGKIDEPRAKELLGVFLRVCNALAIADARDGRATEVARTVILLALEGNRSAQDIYGRALKSLRPQT